MSDAIGAVMKSRSLDSLMQELLPLTQLFKHLKSVPAGSTVIEHTDAFDKRRTTLVKYAGVVCSDEPGEQKSAMARLLLEVDRVLFMGDPYSSSIERANELEGLVSFARQGYIDTLERKEFYDRYEADREARGLRIFSPAFAQSIDEGSIPQLGPTFALSLDALEWRPLLPATYVPLVPQREGKFTSSLVRGERVTFEHTNSRVHGRGCIVLYGALILKDPGAVFMLQP